MEVVWCDVSGVGDADAGIVDLLARLQLGAKRLGCELRVQGASDDLVDLVACMGLTGVLRVQPERQPEEREERGSVEEEGELPDPSV